MSAFGTRMILVSLLLVAAPLSGAQVASSAPCATERDLPGASEALRTMYAALEQGDETRLRAVVDPDFFAFDGGARFDAASLMAVVRSAHDKGQVYHWAVTRPEVRIDCRTAWVSYTNEGGVTHDGIAEPRRWLESAILSFDHGWRVRFLHSTPARQ